MHVRIDEPGDNHAAGGVDPLLRLQQLARRRDLGHFSVLDGDATRSGAICSDNQAAFNNRV